MQFYKVYPVYPVWAAHKNFAVLVSDLHIFPNPVHIGKRTLKSWRILFGSLWIWFSLGAVLWATLSDTCIPGTHHCHTNKYLKKYQHPPLIPYHKIEEMKSIFYPSPRLSKLYFPFGYHFNEAKAGDNDFTQDIWNSNHSAFRDQEYSLPPSFTFRTKNMKYEMLFWLLRWKYFLLWEVSWLSVDFYSI